MANATITISFQPSKLKLFRSKKKSLLVIDGTCINGAINRIRPGNKLLVHIRSSSSLPEHNIDGIDHLATALLMEEEHEESILHLIKGCWVNNVDSTKRVVIKAHANIERNRRGDRLIECTHLLALQEQEDDDYLPTKSNDEYKQYIQTNEGNEDIIFNNDIYLKSERHKIFAHWLIDMYGKEYLSRGTGVIDVAGGNGMISRTLTEMGVRSTLLDPNPRCYSGNRDDDDDDDDNDEQITKESTSSGVVPFGVIPLPLNGDGSDLLVRDHSDDDDIDVGNVIKNCSLLCGLHPDQATEPIVTLALQLNVPFAILPCCVMPSLFPNRVQRRYNNDPVRSYSAFCQYLLDMAPSPEEEFVVDYLPFVGRNKVIYRKRP